MRERREARSNGAIERDVVELGEASRWGMAIPSRRSPGGMRSWSSFRSRGRRPSPRDGNFDRPHRAAGRCPEDPAAARLREEDAAMLLDGLRHALLPITGKAD